VAETCGHSTCLFENRLEYCEIEAGDPNGAVSVVTDMLDALIYDSGAVTSDIHKVTADTDGLASARTFSYLHGDMGSWIWPLTETRLTLRHNTQNVKQQGTNDNYFMTTYGIDVYKDGAVQASIVEPDLIEGGFTTRPMTSYDHEQLFNELSAVYDLHIAERNDNSQAA
jgi:hypothetical protein